MGVVVVPDAAGDVFEFTGTDLVDLQLSRLPVMAVTARLVAAVFINFLRLFMYRVLNV